jgi:large subunit ribosomal protein L9
MDVILLKDVDHLGLEGDTIKVADGYAHNYLLPKALAEKSTAANLRALAQRRRAIERREAEKREAAKGTVERLTETGIVVKALVGEGGRLHGQVTSHQIAEAIQQQTGIAIDRRHVEVHAPIRELGDFTVTAQVYKDVRCEITLHVVSTTGETKADLQPEPEPEPVTKPVAAAEPVVEAEPEPEAKLEESMPADEPEPEEAAPVAEDSAGSE